MLTGLYWLATYESHEIPLRVESSMQSHKKHEKKAHGKGKVKEKDPDKAVKKFSCRSRPKHGECDGIWDYHRHGLIRGPKWTVEWAPCRLDDATRFMNEKHGHAFNPSSRSDDNVEVGIRYSQKKHRNLEKFVYGPTLPQKWRKRAKAAREKDNTGRQAAARAQNQNYQVQQPTIGIQAPPMGRKMFDPQLMAQQQYLDPQAKIQSWMDGHRGANTGMAYGPPPPPPMMPPPQAAPAGQQQGRSHHCEPSRQPAPGEYPPPSANMPPAPAPADGQRHRRRHHKSGSELGPGPVQDFPLRPTMPAGPPMPPSFSGPAPGMPMTRAMDPAPMMHSPQIAPDGQQHRRRHHKSRGEPGPGEDMEPRATYPPPGSMSAGMASPIVMTVPPGMPPPQGQPCGRQHHRRERGPEGGHSHDGQLPTPPLTIRECMSILEEEAVPVPPDPRLRGPRGPAAATPYMPRPIDQPMPPAGRAAHDTPVTTLLPAPPISAPGAPGPRLFPMKGPPPPQAGGMAPPPRPPSFPRDNTSPRPLRPTKQQQQPPPVSMPAFPGTRPGSVVSSAASVRPPPAAPTPPLHPAVLD